MLVTALLLIWSALPIPTTQPGGTIVLEPGFYDAVVIETPCTIRSRIKHMAIISAPPDRHGIDIRVPGCTIDGLGVVGGWDGIKFYADNTTIINNWVVHTKGQGIAGHGFSNCVVEGNTLEDNGTSPRLDHGVYIDGSNNIVANNIIRRPAAYGICIYPAGVGTVIFGNTIDGGGPDCSGVLFQGSGTAFGNTISNVDWGMDWRGIGPFVDGGNTSTKPERVDFLKGRVVKIPQP